MPVAAARPRVRRVRRGAVRGLLGRLVEAFLVLLLLHAGLLLLGRRRLLLLQILLIVRGLLGGGLLGLVFELLFLQGRVRRDLRRVHGLLLGGGRRFRSAAPLRSRGGGRRGSRG